jgi:hypothetical protein
VSQASIAARSWRALSHYCRCLCTAQDQKEKSLPHR